MHAWALEFVVALFVCSRDFGVSGRSVGMDWYGGQEQIWCWEIGNTHNPSHLNLYIFKRIGEEAFKN